MTIPNGRYNFTKNSHAATLVVKWAYFITFDLPLDPKVKLLVRLTGSRNQLSTRVSTSIVIVVCHQCWLMCPFIWRNSWETCEDERFCSGSKRLIFGILFSWMFFWFYYNVELYQLLWVLCDILVIWMFEWNVAISRESLFGWNVDLQVLPMNG